MGIYKIVILYCFYLLVPALSSSQTITIREGWQFHKGPIKDSLSISTKGIFWENVNLPHTWNGLDGQDGGNNYYRGIGFYKTNLQITKDDSSKIIYLKFNAVNSYCEVYVNGCLAGSHSGGYSAFVFNITPFVRLGETNKILVKVDNSATIPAPPVSADFTFFGGISRDVELIKTDKVHIMKDDYGSPGVFVNLLNVSKQSANISVITEVTNNYTKESRVTVKMTIHDAKGKVLLQQLKTKWVNREGSIAFRHFVTMNKPHLWNGRKDPYLYSVHIEILVDGVVKDRSVQPLGIRYFSVDPNLGFFLNGKPYRLYGVAMHEERKDKGRAISDQERKEDLDQMAEMGCTYIRLAHYQHGNYTYAYLDTLGILCSTEIPLINQIKESDEFKANSKQELTELIRQELNHPCICVWGISNEINYKKGPDPIQLIKELNELVHKEDPYRLSALAAMFSETPTNWIPDIYSNNRYDGWYYNNAGDIAKLFDSLHNKFPAKVIGLSEYGAGSNVLHHQEGNQKPAPGGEWHPEEYQSYFHETYWRIILQRPFIWRSTIWVAFDFASDGRKEGGQPGINDKGLITADRTVKKDAYFFYKANWNPIPLVYITERRFTERHQKQIAIKVYSNCEKLTVTLNGKVLNMVKKGLCIFICENAQLQPGKNTVNALGIKGKKIVKDDMSLNYVSAN